MTLLDVDFEKRANSVVLPPSDYRLVAYPILQRQFDELEQVSHDDVILGVTIARNWAGIEGKGFDYDKEYLEHMAELINGCYNEELAFYEIEDICNFFGSEKAGTTMLHFLNPYSYPIYSPEIPHILQDYVSVQPSWQKLHFQTYVEDCQQLSNYNDEYCDRITEIVSSKLKAAGYNYSVGTMRALKMCLIYGTE